jgi:hypothetical protein
LSIVTLWDKWVPCKVDLVKFRVLADARKQGQNFLVRNPVVAEVKHQQVFARTDKLLENPAIFLVKIQVYKTQVFQHLGLIQGD